MGEGVSNNPKERYSLHHWFIDSEGSRNWHANPCDGLHLVDRDENRCCFSSESAIFSESGSSTLGILWCGIQGRSHVEAIKRLFPLQKLGK
jgi:hypothetical protein